MVYFIYHNKKTPNLFDIAKNYQLPYEKLYRAFADYCNGFKNIGISKNDFIELSDLLSELNIKSKVSKIQCNTLILCGEKDNANTESARQLSSNIKNSKIQIICRRN